MLNNLSTTRLFVLKRFYENIIIINNRMVIVVTYSQYISKVYI